MERFRKLLSESLITRFLSYSLIAQLIFPPLWINNVYAALVTDPHASVNFQPQINNTSDIPVVNIVAPNNTGLSHNKYQDFDVDLNGLVFNNSLVTGNSRLAGRIVANPLFGGRTASIILNEVTGASDSELKGLMEVFGDKANVIIANPNGITCNGCGFINTQRGTLTTGTPDLSQGKLRFDIEGGLIRFEEEGHSYRSFVDELDVLSRYIDVSGDISTKDRLSLVAGRFVFDYSKSMVGGSLTEWVEPKSYDAAKDSGRALAVDGTIFGAMQSGQIDIMGTEQGLGVKVDGYLFAQADDLFIQSAGGLAINNADAMREIKLSAQDDITIGADLIANLAIKAEAESIATTEETNLIANKVNLNADSDINLKGEIKTLELDVNASEINVDADLLAINSLSFQSDNVTKIDDSTIGTRKAEFLTKEFLVKDTSFNITELSVQSEKTTIDDSAIDASTVTLNLGSVISNNLNLFAEVAEIQTKDWKGENSQWNITNLNLIGDQLTSTNSSWLVSNGDFNVKDIALANTTLFSYASRIQSSNFSSTSSKIFAEHLSLNIANRLSSISDEWQILPFSDESTTANAGIFELNSKVANFTDSIIRADKYSQVSEKSNFINAGIAANSFDIKSGELNTDEKALWIANEKVDLTAEQTDLSGAIKTTNINLTSDNANISGQWLIAETADIQSKNDLNFKDIGLSAKSLITSFEKGNWDNLIAKTQSNSITASQSLALAATTLESATLSITAETLELDNKTWVGANETQINTRELNNVGTLLTADKLTINSDSIENTGEIASFEAIEIQNKKALGNSGRIIANTLVLNTNELDNSNSIGSENLELVYQNITNTKDAVLSSQNATYIARTNTANFENYGVQIAGDSMAWSSLQDKSGQYTNAGLLSGSNVNFSGLNSVTNGVLLDGEIKGTIQALTKVDEGNTEEKSTEDVAVGTLLIGVEEFTQLGTIKANQITIERDDFHNEGTIHSDKLTANTDARFINRGVIGAQTVDITTAEFINNESSTVSATDTNISNANIINAGELVANEFNITGTTANDKAFINTGTGLIIQNIDPNSLGVSISGFNTFTNNGKIVTEQGFDLSANKIVNNNNIKVTGESNWKFNNLANSQGSLISVDGNWMLGNSVERVGSITNLGKLYGSGIDFYGTRLINGSESQAKNSPKEDRAQFVAYGNDLNIDTTSYVNNFGSLYAKNAFNIKAGSNINNNGVIESFNVANNKLTAGTINNGDGTQFIGKIKTKGNLTIDSNILNINSYGYGETKVYEEVLSYRWEHTGCIGCKEGSARFYPYLDYRYGTYKNQMGSLIEVGGKLTGTGGVWNNFSSKILADTIDANGLSEVNNKASEINIEDVSLNWHRKFKNEGTKERTAKLFDSYYGQNDLIISEVYKKDNKFYWDNIPQDELGTKELSREVSIGIVDLPGNTTLIRTNNMDLGPQTKTLNEGAIVAGEITTGELDEADTPNDGNFINGTDGIIIKDGNSEPTATISLLSFIIPGLSFDALNAASVAGDKTPEELAAQTALQAQLNGLDSDKQNNSDAIKGQTNSYNAQAPSLFDLDADILARIIADTEYELSPEYIFDKVDPDRSLDTEPKFFLDPYQEAQAVTQAALQQTGTAFFSPDWNTSAEQRQGLYDNTLEYLGTQQNVTLGKALTPMQVKQLEQPMIWYVSMNIGGQSQLVPTVYLPEATLDQITTPSAGTIIADSMDIDVSEFKNTGNITVANSARIQADVITNQRNVMTFGDERNYGAIAGTGGNITAGDLALISKTDINNNGGSLSATNGLTLDAQKDINLNALELKRRSQAGKNVTESTDYLLSQLNVGGDATFKAGGDINSQAAQAKIGGNGIFDATNINLLGVTERDYSKTVTKKKGTFSSSKKTIETEQLNFVGSDFQVGGNMVMNAENDITMVGANIDIGKSASIKAGNDITLTAGISTDKYSKQKSGSGVATTSSQQKGHVTETATGTVIKTGESLQIDSDGGNVTILASELDAKENLIFGDMNVKRDENGEKMRDENGQYIAEDGSSINNLTIGTVELKDESWNVKSSGLKGPLKDLAAVAAFAISASPLGQMAMAAGMDTEIEVGKTSESRVESTTHATSTVSAGDTLVVRTDGDLRIEGSQVNATNAAIDTHSTVITAVENTTTTTESESTHTVAATKAALKKDEVTVAGSTETKQSETTTTTDTELVKAGLNISGNLALTSVENIDILASDVNVEGNAAVKAKTITVAGLKEQTTTEHQEKTETTTTSVGVKNAYVDTAYAIQAVADAGAAVDSAKSALDQAKRDVKNGTLQANAIGDYEANLAAATTQLGQATLSAAASGAAAAATTGTGGFYASGSAEKTITEKTSTDTQERYIGSNFNVGGDASFDATDSIDIIGSNMDIAGGLALNAKDVTIKAGTEETTSTSSETTRTAGASYSTNGGASANASGSNTDADSYSKSHVNSSINAGSLTSTSDNLTLSGANVEVAGGIDIDTGNLTIESLQDESSSSSKTEGYSVGAGVSASSMDPSALGANENSSNADSKWVNNQTTLIGGTSGSGDVNISADKATIKGAVLASATRNEDGSLTDNGTLNLATDELIIEDIKDKDHSENKGFDISAGLSSSGSSTVGLTSDGHKTEQNTLATLGGGNITKKDGSAHEEGSVENANSDLNNSQEITKDQQTGGLNATVTVDHRLVTEEGRTAIQKDIVDTTQHALEIGKAVEDVVTTDLNATEVFSQVNKYATDREVLAQQAADKAQQEKLRGEEGAEGSEDGLQNLSDALTEAQGLEEGVDVALFDGSQLQDDTLAIDSTSVNKTEVEGAYHENGGDVYVNIDNTDMTNSVDTVSTLVHEQARHEMAQNGETGSLSRDDQTTLATNRGDRAGDVWETYSGLNGASTQGSGNQQTWNAANQNSANVQQGTQSIAKVNNNELKARQLERNEASLLDQAKNNIANNESLTAEQKAQEIKDLKALACASVECASGVSVNDPLYAELSALQAEGESLIASGEDIESTLDAYGVKIPGDDKDSFEYSTVDKIQDFASSETDEFAQRMISATESLVNGAVVSTVAPAVDVLSMMGDDESDAGSQSFTGYMMEKTNESVDGAINHESEVGQRVKDSFSLDTYEEAPNYALNAGVAGAEIFPIGKALSTVVKPAGQLVNKTGEKLLETAANVNFPLDDSVSKLLKENAAKQSKKKLEYDVDNETGSDVLTAKRNQRIAEKDASEQRMKDTTAHTGDNQHVDNKLYDDLARSNKFEQKDASNKGRKSGVTDSIRRFFQDVKDISGFE